jgi:hypothetical protein
LPDLATHLAGAHLARRLLELARGQESTGRQATLLYLGTILPDLISKPPTIVFSASWVYWLTMPTHTPLGTLLLCYLIALCLEEKERPLGLALLGAGAGLHYLLDLLQKHISSGSYFYFFPFSWKTFHIPLFWPSDSILAVPWLILAILLVEWVGRGRRGFHRPGGL